ncbi:hypothetical protein AVENP_1783 [Arcobacter venerupis]|uniref:Uncharacterized protein n=1 Tax=Arcobacter venerupis TaxID=1054033 RepID=A0AAE7E3J6_9BACT|nr:hypothetical protein AVENP_1783 [Arcobacter venerupis]
MILKDYFSLDLNMHSQAGAWERRKIFRSRNECNSRNKSWKKKSNRVFYLSNYSVFG